MFHDSAYCQLIKEMNKVKQMIWAKQHTNDSFNNVIWTVQMESHRRFARTIYNEKYFSDDHFCYIVCALTWRAWRRVELPVVMSWIRVLDTSSCYERGVPSHGWKESPHGFASTRLRIGQNCRAVCTKKSSLWSQSNEQHQAPRGGAQATSLERSER
jgi:hypothetical protein